MSTKPSACQCESCSGNPCTCNIQTKTERRDGCRCGAVCTCTPETCDCDTPERPSRKRARAVTAMAVTGLALVLSAPARAESVTCGTATLMNVEVVAQWVPQGTITSIRRKPAEGKKAGERGIDAYTTPSERKTKTYLVTARLGDIVYTGRSSGDWFWDFDPTGLVINDAIHACVSNNTLRLERPDGKDYKARIVRVVRAEAHGPASEAPGR